MAFAHRSFARTSFIGSLYLGNFRPARFENTPFLKGMSCFLLLYCFPIAVFSRLRTKGSRFTLGVWGLKVCSLDVTFRTATIRNRPCEDRIAVLMVSSAKRNFFVTFRRQKSCCVARNAFATFSENTSHFSWEAQQFGNLHHHFAWQAQHFIDVTCCVLVANLIVRAARSGEQGANSVAFLPFCEMHGN